MPDQPFEQAFGLAGRVAVVTGSTRGLGRAMAIGLVEAGVSVVICGRTQEGCDTAAATMPSGPGAVMPLAYDVTDWDGAPAFVEQVCDRLGAVDILVNNAAVPAKRSPIEDIERLDWDQVMVANLQGPLRLAQCVAPHMRDHGGGRIVNIASVAAYEARPTSASYAAAKAGLLSLTRSMAVAWAPWNIRVNAISPGPFMTDILREATITHPEAIEQAVAGTLMRRPGEPEELVGSLLYLVSDASSFVTGDDLIVCGGLRR